MLHYQCTNNALLSRQSYTIKGGKVTHFSSKRVHIVLILIYLTLITTNDARKKHHLWQTPSLTHTFWVFPANILNFPCEFTEPFMRNHWTFPANSTNLFCELNELFLWMNWNAERSTLSQRALVIATPSARQVDDEPSATSWIQRSRSVNPNLRLW